MLKSFLNCFKVPELRNKILFTLGIIAVYRVGCFIPTPGVNGSMLAEFFDRMAAQGDGNIFGLVNLFSGGAFEKLTVFSLGVMPYISASIIMSLLTSVIPALEKLQKEGQTGYHKINQYTRYGTLALGVIQSFFIALWLESPQAFQGLQIVNDPGWAFRIVTVLTLSSGTVLLMWLGEQIQERGIGNGISLLITAGIISAAPSAVSQLRQLLDPSASGGAQVQPLTLIIMILFLIFVILAITMIIQGQRRVPVQYARRMSGRTSSPGMNQQQGTYLPLKVDYAGIIAIIFAQSILFFPATISSFVPSEGLKGFAAMIQRGEWWYYAVYAFLIIFFCYFYTAIHLKLEDMAENLKKNGGFIPGVKPGQETLDHLDYIVTRLTFIGAIYICIVAVMPDAIMASFKVPYLVASFFGGTGVLIIVGVMLDTMKQIESHLLMRHYDGFMRSGRMRSGRGGGGAPGVAGI